MWVRILNRSPNVRTLDFKNFESRQIKAKNLSFFKVHSDEQAEEEDTGGLFVLRLCNWLHKIASRLQSGGRRCALHWRFRQERSVKINKTNFTFFFQKEQPVCRMEASNFGSSKFRLNARQSGSGVPLMFAVWTYAKVWNRVANSLDLFAYHMFGVIIPDSLLGSHKFCDSQLMTFRVLPCHAVRELFRWHEHSTSSRYRSTKVSSTDASEAAADRPKKASSTGEHSLNSKFIGANRVF